ncbi:MAG: Hsp20/alpha crystallin family protein [Proteobacteria bacterium]|nr:Hsp20/alpha crystallin family protein [Pseudomonadota bacterium]
MALVRLNPWTPATSFNSLLNRFFDEPFFETAVKGTDEAGLSAWNPVVDIYDNDNSIVFNADLPGVKKEDISVDMDGNILTLKATRNYDKEINEKNFYRKERAFGTFKRSFTLPENVNPETINAEFQDGVLKIEVAKPEEKKAKQIAVK